ncbi:glycosyltransferase family 2 protein [uncultured Arcticibacterium sp.]|uniref:glycosyltransferase family 2 protein n=1 Tax=uncultured Arcticibacterium sp. TaxID=2173042 RepID=UPI0030F934BF
MNTAVVILNFNGKEHLKTFLPSVLEHTKDTDIWLADNGSSDDSISFTEENFPNIKLLSLKENSGFAGGYNRALKQISADYYVLLNSDVEVSENWLKPLIDSLKSSSDLVACQPKILSYLKKDTFEYAGAAGGFLDKWGYPFCRGRIFDHCEKDLGQYDAKIDIFWATGACLVIDANVFHDLGGFDERFFAHMEEIDLCWRIKNAGYRVGFVSESKVYHLGGGTLNKSNPQKTFLNYRNSLAMLAKNLPFWRAIQVIFIRLILDGVSGVKLLLEFKFLDFWAIFRAHFSFYAMLPYLIKTSKGRPKSGKYLYPISIVFTYFVKKIRTYSELKNA